jgi:hypothetical protein
MPGPGDAQVVGGEHGLVAHRAGPAQRGGRMHHHVRRYAVHGPEHGVAVHEVGDELVPVAATEAQHLVAGGGQDAGDVPAQHAAGAGEKNCSGSVHTHETRLPRRV